VPAASGSVRAGRAFVELFAPRLRSGQADDQHLVRGLRRAEKRLKAFGDRIRSLGLKIAGLGTAMLAPLIAAAKAIVKVPVAAYVEKVYEEGSFAGLGIGT
jgi:hypothetical protein